MDGESAERAGAMRLHGRPCGPARRKKLRGRNDRREGDSAGTPDFPRRHRGSQRRPWRAHVPSKPEGRRERGAGANARPHTGCRPPLLQPILCPRPGRLRGNPRDLQQALQRNQSPAHPRGPKLEKHGPNRCRVRGSVL